MHEVTPAALSAQTLGMRIIFSHGVCANTDKIMCRVRSALRVLMHRRPASGRVVQLIAGHRSFGAIVSPGALSSLDSVYKFLAKDSMSLGFPHADLFSLERRLDQLLGVTKSIARMLPKWSIASRTAHVSLVARGGRVFGTLSLPQSGRQ